MRSNSVAYYKYLHQVAMYITKTLHTSLDPPPTKTELGEYKIKLGLRILFLVHHIECELRMASFESSIRESPNTFG